MKPSSRGHSVAELLGSLVAGGGFEESRRSLRKQDSMTMEYEQALDPQRRQAIAELSDLIRQHYPTVTFSVEPSADDPVITHLWAKAIIPFRP